MLTTIEKENSCIISFQDYSRLNDKFRSKILKNVKSAIKNGNHTVFLDLQNVFFIDTCGFSLLKEIQLLAETTDCNLNLINVSFELGELFYLMQMENMFEKIK